MSTTSSINENTKIGSGAFASVYSNGSDLVTKVYKKVDDSAATEVNTMLTIRKNRGMFYESLKALEIPFASQMRSSLMTMKQYSVDPFSDQVRIVMKRMHLDLLEFRNKYKIKFHDKWDIIVLHIARLLAVALFELRISGIIHGDLKPDNIMISLPRTMSKKNVNWLSNMRLKIIDFNKSLLGSSVLKSTGIQTFYYSAPEIILGDREYTYGVDVWAVGCIIGELLLGTPLFNPLNEQSNRESTSVSASASSESSSDNDSSSNFSYNTYGMEDVMMLHTMTHVLGPIPHPKGRFVYKFFHKTLSENPKHEDKWLLNGTVDSIPITGAGIGAVGISPWWQPLLGRMLTYDYDRITSVDMMRMLDTMSKNKHGA